MSARSLCLLFGFIFLAIGLLGFTDNPVIGDSPDALFHADFLHTSLLVGSGAFFTLVGLIAPVAGQALMAIFGIMYLLIGILGLIDIGTGGMGRVLGILEVNMADTILHIVLGLVILFGSLAVRTREARYE